jgi:hypothetical protein
MSRFLQRAGVLSLAIVGATASLHARAQTKGEPSAADAAEAKKHFELGLKLYKEKLFEAALAEFLTSYELSARPSALRNAAQSQRDLRHFADAHALFAKLLAEHAAQLSPAEREAVKRALTDLELTTAKLTIAVNVAGAKIEIDGRSVGVAPLAAPIRVDVGAHKIHVALEGYEAFDKQLLIGAQQSVEVEADLVKDVSTGTITVREASGKRVHVFVDDLDRGAAPADVDLTPGAHAVELRGEGISSERRMIEVVRKATATVSLTAVTSKGHLRIETLGNAGTISVDGREVGEGGWDGDLAVGAHRVRVTRPGYVAYEHLVAVKRGETVVDAVTLVSASGSSAVPFPYRGMYGRISLVGAFSLTGAGATYESVSWSGEASVACVTGPSCSVGKPLGGAGVVNVGYSFDWFSLELVGAFLADYRSTDRTWVGDQAQSQFHFVNAKGAAPATTDLTVNESFSAVSFAGFAGLGARVTSKDDAVRFTLGASFGGAFRATNLKRQLPQLSIEPGSVSTFSPTVVLDAGMLFGSTPGTKFSLGVLAWIEAIGAPAITPSAADAAFQAPLVGTQGPWTTTVRTPAQTVLSGTQVYVGPALGLQFGR